MSFFFGCIPHAIKVTFRKWQIYNWLNTYGLHRDPERPFCQSWQRPSHQKGPGMPSYKIQSVLMAHNFELLQQAFWLKCSLKINSQWEIILVTRRKYAENHSSLRLQSNHPTVGILWWSFKDDNKVIKDRTLISMKVLFKFRLYGYRIFWCISIGYLFFSQRFYWKFI